MQKLLKCSARDSAVGPARASVGHRAEVGMVRRRHARKNVLVWNLTHKFFMILDDSH